MSSFFVLRYSFLFFLSFFFFYDSPFSEERNNRREGRDVPARTAIVTRDRMGGRQAQRVCILSLLFLLLSSFLLLRTTKTGRTGWDRTGWDDAGGNSNTGREGDRHAGGGGKAK